MILTENGTLVTLANRDEDTPYVYEYLAGSCMTHTRIPSPISLFIPPLAPRLCLYQKRYTYCILTFLGPWSFATLAYPLKSRAYAAASGTGRVPVASTRRP